jgi:hypothetical protein
MTEFELLQLQISYNEAIASYTMNFVSILSGYLLANHFLGHKITRMQFIIMTLTYSFVMLLTTAAVYQAVQEWFLAEQILSKIDRSWESVDRDGTLAIPMVVSLLITYCGSLYFAFTSRKRHESAA